MRVALAATLAAAAAAYEPTWASLDTRPLPQWYDDAKFGIFIHYGVFTVPAYYGEWFWWAKDCSAGNDPPDDIEKVNAFFNRTEVPGSTYQDYASRFRAEFFNASAWAAMFADAGAQYAVLTTKHHEGFAMWPSAWSWSWNAATVGPRRDVVGEFSAAIRAAVSPHTGRAIRLGLYHSAFEWFNALYLADKASNWSSTAFRDGKRNPELYDLVRRYAPDLLWSDGDWEATDAQYWHSPEFLAWLTTNSSVAADVVFNDRWGGGDMCAHGSFFTCADNFQPGKLLSHKWEAATPIDTQSWGFRREAVLSDYMTADAIIAQLVSTVAFGGNLLLNVGPRADGTIDTVFADRLAAVGRWLRVNGAAIYDTRPWLVAQNDTAASAYYTLSPPPAPGGAPALNAILTAWPAAGTVTLAAPAPGAATAVALLGHGPVSWAPAPGGGVAVTLPALAPPAMPCDSAWTLVLTGVANVGPWPPAAAAAVVAAEAAPAAAHAAAAAGLGAAAAASLRGA